MNVIWSEVYSETPQISEMELFAKVVDFKKMGVFLQIDPAWCLTGFSTCSSALGYWCFYSWLVFWVTVYCIPMLYIYWFNILQSEPPRNFATTHDVWWLKHVEVWVEECPGRSPCYICQDRYTEEDVQSLILQPGKNVMDYKEDKLNWNWNI